MRLYSARPDTVVVTGLRARPLQMGAEEYIYPAKTMDLAPGFSEWEEPAGKNALEMYGRSGVVAAKQGETDDQVVLGAKRIRHKFIIDQLMNFRRVVDAQHKAGAPTPLPDASLYALSAEYRELDQWVKAKDPVFAAIGGLPTETPAQQVDNVMAEHLKQFGVGAPPTPAPPTAIEIPV